MKKRDFDVWFSNLRTTIHGYDYYVDFPKAYTNVEGIKVELNIMNSLIGSKDIEKEYNVLLKKYPEIIRCIPILLAVRLKDIKNNFEIVDELKSYSYDFTKVSNTPEEYRKFMKRTGLFDLISNHIINNLVDYVLGVEVGLDSNGRKNRGGHDMEDLVEHFIKDAGFRPDVDYFKEMYLDEVERKWGISLSSLSNEGKARKRFDFVIKTKSTIYAIETNFYTGGGSKLNETARSYKLLAEESRDIEGFTFVWVTDGAAWSTAKGNLRETFDALDTIYNIKDLEDGVLKTEFN